MPRPPYIDQLRRGIGTGLVMVPCVGTVVRRDDGRLLLVRSRDQGWWTVPGGLIDPRETHSDAAVRETWEETGLIVRLTHLIGVFGGPDYIQTYDNGDIINFYATVFAAQPAHDYDAQALDRAAAVDHEISAVGWYAPNDAFELNLKHDAADYLRAALNGDRGVYTAPNWTPPDGTQPA